MWESKKIKIFICVLLLSLSGCARMRAIVSPDKGDKESTYYFLLSELDTRRSDLPSALTHLNKAIEKDPNQPYLLYKRAFLQASVGEIKKAQADAQKALLLSPHHAPSLILLGKLYQSQEKWEAAIQTYRKALAEIPTNEEANALLIEAYVAQKNYRSAVTQVRSWEKLSPDDVIPLFYEANLHQNFIKNSSAAIEVYQRILKMEPDNMKALMAMAEIYIGHKEDKKVLEVLKQMEVLAPEDMSLKVKIALIYYEHKEYDRAIDKFKELLALHVNQDRVIYYMGVIFENLKRDPEALSEFEKIGARSDFYKDAQLHRAFLNRRTKKDDEAIRVLETAIRNRPEAGAFYEYLSEIYRDQKNYPRAVEILKKGISKSEDKEILYYTLGVVYDMAGQFEDGIASMRKVLKINPQNASALNYIGYSYADRGLHLEEAEALVRKALALKPDDGFITDSLGWVYFKKGDLGRAEELVGRAYKSVSGEPTIGEHMGDIYLKKNNKSLARRYFQEALANLKKKEFSKPEEVERLKKKIEDTY